MGPPCDLAEEVGGGAPGVIITEEGGRAPV